MHWHAAADYSLGRAPKTVIGRINTAMNVALGKKAVRERFLASSTEPVGKGPEVLCAVIAQEVPKWTTLVHSLDLKMD